MRNIPDMSHECGFVILFFSVVCATLQSSEHDLAHLCIIKASITKCPPSEQDPETETEATFRLLGEIVFSARCMCFLGPVFASA
ncbi:hypothetical protein KOW79_020486 [Hemibagrus wyckioides]|uniref:Secreted protein n=1 Tax=Hemibagrus wyckioides TaxID=337641 RepID=A0A9D3S9R4_9TELE|nr:hypothetical protein KOW79_020486 [Hemibagrus wyckioides]